MSHRVFEEKRSSAIGYYNINARAINVLPKRTSRARIAYRVFKNSSASGASTSAIRAFSRFSVFRYGRGGLRRKTR